MLTDPAVLNPSPAAVDAPLFSVLGSKACEAILARNSVEHGWLRLEGVTNSRRTRNDVVRRLHSIKGSRGVIDMLRVTGPATTHVFTDPSNKGEYCV